MGRIAHVVLSYKNIEQVERLVRRLQSGGQRDLIIVHHDPKGEPWPIADRPDTPDVVFAPEEPVLWGHWSQVESLVRCFEVALDAADIDWVAVHSGQDYPLVSNEAIHAVLDNSEYDGFLYTMTPLGERNVSRGMRQLLTRIG